MVTCRTYTIEKAPTPGFTLTADQYNFIGTGTTTLHISYAAGAGKTVRIVNSDIIDSAVIDTCQMQDITLDSSGVADIFNYPVVRTQVIYAILKLGTDNHDCCTDFSTTTCQYSNYIQFIVTAPPSVLTSVDITPATPSMIVGTSITLTATPRDQNNVPITTGVSITWSSSDPDKATVNPTTGPTTTLQGIAITTTPVTITATATDGVNTVIGMTTVMVTAQPPTLTSITVSPSSATVAIGSTQQFSAICKDQNNNVMTCPTLAWDTTDHILGTVSSGGLFTANASLGTVTVTATVGTIVGSATVTLSEVSPVQAGFGAAGMVLIAGLAVGALYMATRGKKPSPPR